MSNRRIKEDKMQYETKPEISEQNRDLLDVVVTLERFLEGDNKALERMLKVVDITRTDVQQQEQRLEQ